MEEQPSLELNPIGIIHSPYSDREQAPRQGSGQKEICRVEVFRQFEQGLKDIERFSHITLIYWLHKSVGYHLLVTTPRDSRLCGLFGTRSPNRPNPLGLCVVELVAKEGRILKVRGLDAIDGTPLLDIKPHIPSIDEKT